MSLPGPFAFGERTLERRAIDFEGVPPIVTASFAFTVIFLVVGLLLLPGVIAALARARGYRAPYIALTIAVVCYVLNRLLLMVYYLLLVDGLRSITYVLTSNVAALWGGLTDVFIFLAVLLLLQNRATSLSSVYPHEGGGYGLVKKLGDWVLVALMGLWVLVNTSVIASANAAVRYGNISPSEQRNRIKGAYAVRHLADVFNFFILVNIGISALVLRSRIVKYKNARDKPTNAVAFIIFPILIVHYFYRMYASIQASSDFFGRALSSASMVKRTRILTLIGTLETSILIAVIFIVLIVNGYNRERWNTFGDIPANAKPQWTGHQPQPMGMYQQQPQQYYANGQMYPQQQQYVVGQVYSQPQPGIVYSQPQPTVAYAQPQQLQSASLTPQSTTATPVGSSPPMPASAVPNVPQV